jgi:hypothetical protein
MIGSIIAGVSFRLVTFRRKIRLWAFDGERKFGGIGDWSDSDDAFSTEKDFRLTGRGRREIRRSFRWKLVRRGPYCRGCASDQADV